MTKKQIKTEMKKLNRFDLTPTQRAAGRIAHAEEVADKALASGKVEYANIYIEIAKTAAQKYGLITKYA